MGRAKRVATGTRHSGMAIEYIRARKLVRLVGWAEDAPLEPVEIPVDELCDRLGIDPSDITGPRQYLLFAGSHANPGGGLRDLVGTFESEEKAWEAFRALRQGHPSVQGWAQLAVVDGAGRINQLAWFGLHTASPTPPAGERRRALRRRIAAVEPVSYLRVVTPS